RADDAGLLAGSGAEKGRHEERGREAEAADGGAEEDERQGYGHQAEPGDPADRRFVGAAGKRLQEDDEAEQRQDARKDDREVARPHPQRGADLIAERSIAEGEAYHD